MNQRRTIAAVSLLVIVGGLLLFASPQATIKAPAQPTTKKQTATKKKKVTMKAPRKYHPVLITPGVTCTAPNVALKKSNQEFATWRVVGNPADTYRVKFDKPANPAKTPCDNGMDTLDIPGGGGESTACTVQNATNGTYNYSIFKVAGSTETRCADPSVDVQD